jgi:prepilin-type N-terminal cleavage/methylation domain-containing protein
MSKHITTHRSQAGFTLVELAIVMIIIGLLIGGVLKGQELIKNAQVTSTIAQLKGIDGATSSFRDMYNGLPGDIANPTTRLPNCTTGVCAGTTAASWGDNVLNTVPGVAPGTEATAYFVHLSHADLLTGVNPAAVAGECGTWGACFPEASIRGAGIMVGSSAGNVALATSTAANADVARGTYLTLTAGPNLAMPGGAGAGGLTPNQAARIDTKVDNGQPLTGSVIYGGNGNCIANTSYNEQLTSSECNLYVRIQG